MPKGRILRRFPRFVPNRKVLRKVVWRKMPLCLSSCKQTSGKLSPTKSGRSGVTVSPRRSGRSGAMVSPRRRSSASGMTVSSRKSGRCDSFS